MFGLNIIFSVMGGLLLITVVLGMLGFIVELFQSPSYEELMDKQRGYKIIDYHFRNDVSAEKDCEARTKMYKIWTNEKLNRSNKGEL